MLYVQCFFIAADLFAENLYIKSQKIYITESPGGSNKIVVLRRGTKVQKIDSKNRWIQVKFKSTVGWLHQYSVSPKVPRKRVSLLVNRADISKKARVRASAYTSAVASRGFLESDEVSMRHLEKPDYMALVQIEDQAVDVEEAIRFIEKNE